MKVHTTNIEPINVFDSFLGDENVAVSIETYYDAHLRLWTAVAQDAAGYQVLTAIYGFSQAEALNEMTRELKSVAR